MYLEGLIKREDIKMARCQKGDFDRVYFNNEWLDKLSKVWAYADKDGKPKVFAKNMDCSNGQAREVVEWAKSIVAEFNTYAEFAASI